MPQIWTEDPTIGNALASLGNTIAEGPKLRLQAMNVRSEVELRDLQRRQLEEQMRAATGAAAANKAYWSAQAPPDIGAPNQAAWATSGGPISTERVPPTGLVPLTPYSTDIATKDAAAQSSANSNYNLLRDLQTSQYELGARHATSFTDVAGATPKAFAQTQLQLGGVPTNPVDQIKMQTQLKGELPLTFENKAGKNYVVRDAQGNVVEQGVTNDNGRTNVVGKRVVPPQGGSVLLAGEAPVDSNMFKDPASMLQSVSSAAQKVMTGGKLDPVSAMQHAVALGQLYPTIMKVEKDDNGNLRVVTLPEKQIPGALLPLVSHINSVLAPPAGLPAATTTAAPPVPAAATAAATPPATTAAAPPAAAPPVVGAAPTVGAPIVAGGGHEMRREINQSQTYQQYMNAMISYQKIQDAFKSNNLAADLNGIYALAKLFDPGSAVREGELQMAGGTGSLGERLMGMYNSLSGSGGRLTKEMRQDILNEGYKAANAQYTTAKVLGDHYTGVAQRQGFNPADVVPPITQPAQYDPSLVNVEGHAPSKARQPKGEVDYNELDRKLGLTR